jgi:hypothetical protein
MKIGRLIALGLVGYASYKIYKNREVIKEDFISAKSSIEAAKIDLDKIQTNLSIIKEQRENMQNISQDLTYKFRVFDKEKQAHMTEINHTLAKYQISDTNIQKN